MFYLWFKGPPGLTGPKGERGEPGLPALVSSTTDLGMNIKGDKGRNEYIYSFKLYTIIKSKN